MTHPTDRDHADAAETETPPRWTHDDHTGDHDDLASAAGAATQTHGEPHGADDHGEAETHDDHAHAGEDMDLGPVDWTAWGVGALGVALGLVTAGVLALGQS